MRECIICCERKEEHVECLYCKKEVCADCFRQEMLMEYREPRCMMCKNLFSIEWIVESQPREWIVDSFWPFWGRWRRERERQWLPDEEEEASNVLRARGLREQMRGLPLLKRMLARKCSIEEIEAVRQQKRALQEAIRQLVGKDRSRRVARAVIGFCPWQGCHGFLRADGRCGLCHGRSCQDCGIPIGMDDDDDAHRCDPDQRESFLLIRRETKPCPGCSAPIFFMGGCDQMWCTACHTLFSWHSGEIIDERIHNPHYYEWVRQQQQQDDAPPPPIMALDGMDIPPFTVYSGFLIRNNLDYRLFSDLHMAMAHLHGAVLPRLDPDIPDDKDLRVRYLTGDLSDEQWAHLLEYREKKRLKWTSIRALVETNLAVMRDLIRLSIIRPHDPPTREDVDQIKRFAEERIETILRCHGGDRNHPGLKWIHRIRIT